MSILGNFLLVISAVLYFILNMSLVKAPPQNDGAVGYYWSLIILNVAVAILMMITVIIIGYAGGLEWISEKKSNRVLYTGIGMASIVVTIAFSALFKYEHGPVPGLLRFYSSFVPILLPLIIIITGFILVNPSLRNTVPASLYKWPLIIAAIMGVSGTVSAIGGFVMESQRNKSARIQSAIKAVDENHERMLADIDSCDVTKNIVFMFVFTDNNQDADVHERALAKIKTHPQWQQELIRLLQLDWAPEAFTFLASNSVDNPELFPKPVNAGVLIQANLIRQSIRNASHPSHFYQGQFSWEVERVLRTVDKFKNKGVDFAPAVKELRNAFNERSEYEKPRWVAMDMVEEWLKKNS
jgi:hypothetical protein